MSTIEIVHSYYVGVAQKNGWQDVISDEIAFTGPGINTTGKNAYVEITARFLHGVDRSKVKQMIIEGDNACVVVTYEMLSPKGNRMSADVAEILSVRNGKIDSSTIFFDTLAFKDFTAQG